MTTERETHGESGSTRAGRVAAIVTGALVSLLALGLVIGAVALLTAMSIYDEQGFTTTPAASLQTDTYAIVSEPIEFHGVDTWSPAGDEVRLRVSVADASQPAFVGIAPAAEARTAFRGVGHAVVSGATSPRFGMRVDEYDTRDGAAPPTDPADLLEWESQATGTGDLALTWTPRDGEWVIVTMNADGSPGVELDLRAGVDIPWLDAAAWGLLALGVLTGALATLLMLVGIGRTHHHRPTLPTADAGVAHTEATAPAPRRSVRVTASMTDPPGRWLWLIKWLLLIPHYIVLVVLLPAFAVCTVLAWFAVVFTGRYPRALFDFNVGVLRWSWRVSGYSYSALATDRYPPFSLADDEHYPVRFDVDYPQHLSRALPFVKWLLAFPHLLLLGAGAGGVVIGTANQDGSAQMGVIGVLVLILAVGLLFTGRVPRGVFDLLVGVQRWMYRTVAYVALLTDEYPPFRLDQGGEEIASNDDHTR